MRPYRGRVLAYATVLFGLTCWSVPARAQVPEVIARAVRALKNSGRATTAVELGSKSVAGASSCVKGACSLEVLETVEEAGIVAGLPVETSTAIETTAQAAVQMASNANLQGAGAVVFLCVGNSARSQMAEAIAAHLFPNVEVYSAGSIPKGVNPYAVRVLEEIGIDISQAQSKTLEAIDGTRVKTAITMCADGACPFFPGTVQRQHWPFPDPAAVTGTDQEILAAFREARDGIRARLEKELASVVTAQSEAVATVAAAPRRAGGIAEVTEAEFQSEVIEASHRGPVIVKFHAPW